MPQLKKCAWFVGPIDFKEAVSDKPRFSYKSGGLICKACFGEDKTSRCILAGTVNFIEHISRAPYERLAMIKVSKDVGMELEEIMKKFMGYHVDRQINSLAFLEKISK